MYTFKLKKHHWTSVDGNAQIKKGRKKEKLRVKTELTNKNVSKCPEENESQTLAFRKKIMKLLNHEPN